MPLARILRESSVSETIAAHARDRAEANAILSPGQVPLTYGRLANQIDETVRTLNALGVGRGDRVAIVLPDGPEAAVATVAVMAGTVAVPLNPGCKASELDEYFARLGIAALIVGIADTAAVGVARARAVPVFELTPCGDAAGTFYLAGDVIDRPVNGGPARPEEIGFIAMSSGTTSRPKLITRTQRVQLTVASDIAESMELTTADRCLNVMPLFHGHGRAMLHAALVAGASCVCPRGFEPASFFEWLEDFRPTYYSCVPTIHQAILELAPNYMETIRRAPLRFIRSGSAGITAEVIEGLEETFQAPVVQGYVLTETSVLAATPLPPKRSKPGSVGHLAATEVAVLDESGMPLPRGERGELVVRDPTVLEQYEDDPEINERSYVDGWFRTGELGYVDDDGFLFLTGRTKEVINRGGEKVSPLEIDDVLRRHPAVAQVAAFPVPHATLGEDVAAAVVLRHGAAATSRELRRFVAKQLSDAKVPRQIVFVDALPTNAIGKIARNCLAEQLGLTVRPAASARPGSDRPDGQTATEACLASLFARVLGLRHVDIDDDFFRLGGDSIRAARLFVEIRTTFGKNLPLSRLLEGASVRHVASLLEQAGPAAWASLVSVQPRGSRPPFFCVHPIGGHVLVFRSLARLLGPDQPFYGLQAVGLDGVQKPLTRLEEMAARYIGELQSIQPNGPYYLGGYSSGGGVALEMAQQLTAQGEQVALLAIVDHRLPHSRAPRLTTRLRHFIANLPGWFQDVGRRSATERRDFARRRLQVVQHRIARKLGMATVPDVDQELADFVDTDGWSEDWQQVVGAQYRASRAYVPRPYPGRVVLFRARRQPLFCNHDPAMGWNEIALGGLEVRVVPGHHLSMMTEPNVITLAGHLRTCLRLAQQAEASVTTISPRSVPLPATGDENGSRGRSVRVAPSVDQQNGRSAGREPLIVRELADGR